jgi:hypothetical protein
MLISALALGIATIGSIGAITLASSKDKKENAIQKPPVINNNKISINNSFNKENVIESSTDNNKLREDIVSDIRNIFKEEEASNMQNYIDDIDQILAKYK